MTDSVRDEISQLTASIRALERQLETALAKRRIELNYNVRDGVVHFEQAVLEKHRLLRMRLMKNSTAPTAPTRTEARSEERG